MISITCSCTHGFQGEMEGGALSQVALHPPYVGGVIVYWSKSGQFFFNLTPRDRKYPAGDPDHRIQLP